MENEIGLAYKITMELILTAIVLGVVIAFTYVSNKAYHHKKHVESVKLNTEAYAELYEYDNKVLSGSDVVDILLTYTRVYEFEVVLESTTIRFNPTAELSIDSSTGKVYGLNLWSLDTISKKIGSDINSRFISEINRDATNNYIVGLIFRKE